MPKRIFIGGLSAQTTDAELQGLCRGMSGLGGVRLERGADGGVRGVAEFETDADGTTALRQLQGKSLNGQRLSVTEER